MRKFVALFLPALVTCFLCSAQIRYIPPTAHSFGIGAGFGVAVLQGDVKKIYPTGAIRLNLYYNITSYFDIGIESQTGGLAAGTYTTRGLYTKESFSSVDLNLRVSSGQFLRNRITPGSIFGGLYVGLGAGLIHDKVNRIGTKFLNGKTVPGIVRDATSLKIPFNLGMNLELPRLLGKYNMVANINYQYNFVRGEDLDGYNYDAKANESSDGYSFFSIGVKYNFGRLSGR